MELWFTERHTPYVNFSIKVERQLYTAQSEFQRIDVFESREFGRFLTLDGYMMLTEKDEFIYHEMITHIPMAVHPNPTYPSGHWLFGFDSKKYHPVTDFNPTAWTLLGLSTRYYNAKLHRSAFSLPTYVEELLRDVEPQ